jgi:iron complex outermembrane receptor protein
MAVLLSLAGMCRANAESPVVAGHESLDEVVVLATRMPEHAFDLPASVDRVDGTTIRDGRIGVNLSESLAEVPGLSVQNRQNYAQDLQMSLRGFGARSSFGVRGVRLYADGIPGTMPDGQGQFSHFDLSSADRIEVLRGPFSALYGNSSGGVVSIFTADGTPGLRVDGTAATGNFGTERFALEASGGVADGATYTASGTHFETTGYRDHSSAERNIANTKFGIPLGKATTLTIVANAIETPDVQDPLGLTRAQLEADPTQAGTNAVLYNTRKSLLQKQLGATLDAVLGDHDDLTLTSYAGQRSTTQFQAILRAAQLNPLHPGGVVDLSREYRGADVHIADRRDPGGTPLTVTVGVAVDGLEEHRKGFQNFVGNQLGVIGAMRRDERNRVRDGDEYIQAEWLPASRWRVLAGLRHSEIDIDSHDELGSTPPSSLRYAATNPVAGITYEATAKVNAYLAYGRGFETPTLNDLAYRSTDGSSPGLNDGLQPAHSDNYEAGVKVLAGRLRAEAAAFYIRTHNELAVKESSAGRTVYENIGLTERRGAEVAVSDFFTDRLEARLAYTYLHAVTLLPYESCAGQPCSAVEVPAGSRLPAVPANALYAALAWHAPRFGFTTSVETIGRAHIYVDDRNTDAAAGYWVANIVAGFKQVSERWSLSETLRADNVFDRPYIGTVIVNDANRRFFEPSPGRTLYLIFAANFR